MGLRSPVGNCDDMLTWLETGYTKVLLGANETGWSKMKAIPGIQIVADLGKTELEPGTETVAAFWPMRKSQADKLFTRFQVFKGLTLEESFAVFNKSLEHPWVVLAAALRAGLPGQPAAGIGYDEQLVHDLASVILAWKERWYERVWLGHR